MVMSFRLSNAPQFPIRETRLAECKGVSYRDLAAQATRAVREHEGIDVTDMSREERAKSFFGE